MPWHTLPGGWLRGWLRKWVRGRGPPQAVSVCVCGGWGRALDGDRTGTPCQCNVTSERRVTSPFSTPLLICKHQQCARPARQSPLVTGLPAPGASEGPPVADLASFLIQATGSSTVALVARSVCQLHQTQVYQLPWPARQAAYGPSLPTRPQMASATKCRLLWHAHVVTSRVLPPSVHVLLFVWYCRLYDTLVTAFGVDDIPERGTTLHPLQLGPPRS